MAENISSEGLHDRIEELQKQLNKYKKTEKETSASPEIVRLHLDRNKLRIENERLKRSIELKQSGTDITAPEQALKIFGMSVDGRLATSSALCEKNINNLRKQMDVFLNRWITVSRNFTNAESSRLDHFKQLVRELMMKTDVTVTQKCVSASDAKSWETYMEVPFPDFFLLGSKFTYGFMKHVIQELHDNSPYTISASMNTVVSLATDIYTFLKSMHTKEKTFIDEFKVITQRVEQYLSFWNDWESFALKGGGSAPESSPLSGGGIRVKPDQPK